MDPSHVRFSSDYRLRGSWLEQKERQNREAEQNPDADPQAQIARLRRLQHRQPQHNQKSAKRGNEPQNASLIQHGTTLTQPMTQRWKGNGSDSEPGAGLPRESFYLPKPLATASRPKTASARLTSATPKMTSGT